MCFFFGGWTFALGQLGHELGAAARGHGHPRAVRLVRVQQPVAVKVALRHQQKTKTTNKKQNKKQKQKQNKKQNRNRKPKPESLT